MEVFFIIIKSPNKVKLRDKRREPADGGDASGVVTGRGPPGDPEVEFVFLQNEV